MLEETHGVLFLGALCSTYGYKLVWDGKKDPILTSPKGHQVVCKPWHNVLVVVPGTADADYCEKHFGKRVFCPVIAAPFPDVEDESDLFGDWDKEAAHSEELPEKGDSEDAGVVEDAVEEAGKELKDKKNSKSRKSKRSDIKCLVEEVRRDQKKCSIKRVLLILARLMYTFTTITTMSSEKD